ncbi:hypothetical protein HNY73_008260 [Argiope bruennichi]|uniref:Uncharacterized protein n=1 Tax=Argiope bruennichi TaxID=94029 RepID=A0A8T0F5U4_ARGBR|nr:hypothetical protein HNY73_008260 [Argiope bruennichi]
MPLDKLIARCYTDFKEFADVEKDCELNYYQNIRCPKEDHKVLYACYTLHTLIGLPDGEEEEVSTQTTEILVLDSVPTEYNLKIKEAEFQLSIHHSKNILNPYDYGHSLKKGHTNLFRLTKECIEECQRNSSMEILGCIVHMLKGPTNEKICKLYPSDERVLQAAHECAVKNCKPACYEMSYEATKDVVNFDIIGNCYDIFGDTFSSVARVVIKLDGLQTTTFTYSPKYQGGGV